MSWVAQRVLAATGTAQPGDCLREADLALRTGLTETQTENACRVLVRRGLLTRRVAGCHNLTAEGRAALDAGSRIASGPQHPHVAGRRIVRAETARDRMWSALRMEGKATLDDLVMLVAQGTEADLKNNLMKYMRMLERAGYVKRLPVKEAPLVLTSNGCIRWWLLPDRNTGPIAPRPVPKRRALYDANRDRDYPFDGSGWNSAEVRS